LNFLRCFFSSCSGGQGVASLFEEAAKWAMDGGQVALCSRSNISWPLQRHFDFMWQSGYSDHSQPTYNSLRGLLASAEERNEVEFEPDEEQAYMVGATALDCSIMLTFQEIEIKCETDCPAGQR